MHGKIASILITHFDRASQPQEIRGVDKFWQIKSPVVKGP